MTARRKIGVLTFHKSINYGSYWQARCLVEGLRSAGHDAELLDHQCKNVIRAELRCALQPRLPERTARKDMAAYTSKVRSFGEAFGGLPMSRPFSLHDPAALQGYETIIVGSDEVWNLSHPWFGGEPIFYGAGIEARLVSYAASFGSYSCHWGIDPYWASQLKRFNGLSVRDENSYWLVRGATGRVPDIVLDPCLQFPEAAAIQPFEEQEPYALVYGHSFPDWLKRRIKEWARTLGLRLLSVGYRNDFADGHRIEAGPLEFAALVAGARSVVTNFFHGCVFAILHGKPFVAAGSDYRSNKLAGLVRLLSIPDRILMPDATSRNVERLLDAPPDVGEQLAECRCRSGAYIEAALA